MVLISTILTKLNRTIAPSLLRSSLLLRHALSPNKPLVVDNPYLDSFFLMPLAQKLISIEVQQVAKERRREVEIARNKKNNAMDDFVDKVWSRYLEKLSSPLTNIVDETIEDDENHSDRLKAFIEYMRPVLAPNGTFKDVNRWRFHNRFIKWLRSEYLICKYSSEISETLSKYPKLQYCALLDVRSKLRDTMRYGISTDLFIVNKNEDASQQHAKALPSFNLVNDAFQMHNWNKTKSTSKEYDLMRHLSTKVLDGSIHTLPGTNIQIPDIDEQEDIRSLKFEEILEVAGCHVSNCNAFNALCDDADIYEFWTDEYVVELSKYLMQRYQDLSIETEDKEIVIVDVGAGDGVLAQFLREKMTSKNKILSSRKRIKGSQKQKGRSKRSKTAPMTVIATDDGSWQIKPKANVEKLGVSETLEKYKPYSNNRNDVDVKRHHLIVICSWMPMGEDWTQAFRDTNVDEYILIGECDDGNCGHNWQTWGNKTFIDHGEELEISPIPPYTSDGYERNELEALTKLQFSRFDSAVSSSSKTVSFRKMTVK